MMMNKGTIEMYFTITVFFEINPLKILNQYLFDDIHNTNPIIVETRYRIEGYAIFKASMPGGHICISIALFYL
ncbi:hypothetical protein XBO1_480004 [Xenorhabdus bovienii str. oregonense]|uniref:Uncharacterized protein n=1 Tax=Xenorhabdus bovienii str. oregonense TaxID=1398202 RepID=A0A077P9Y0_XENBV|nr:hypothetical protein XBO1_480004 [Xenorhabdus bovienii str. oregonense]